MRAVTENTLYKIGDSGLYNRTAEELIEVSNAIFDEKLTEIFDTKMFSLKTEFDLMSYLSAQKGETNES